MRNHGDKNHHGDILKWNKNGCARILLCNKGGIGLLSACCSKESLKMEKVEKLVLETSVDLVCLTETNKDWNKVEYENTIWGTTTS